MTPSFCESSGERIIRIGSLRRKIYDRRAYQPKVETRVTGSEIEKICEEGNIPYIPSYERFETIDDQHRRIKGLKRRILHKNYNSKRKETSTPS